MEHLVKDGSMFSADNIAAIITAVITTIGGIFTAIIAGLFTYSNREKNKRLDELEKKIDAKMNHDDCGKKCKPPKIKI